MLLRHPTQAILVFLTDMYLSTEEARSDMGTAKALDSEDYCRTCALGGELLLCKSRVY